MEERRGEGGVERRGMFRGGRRGEERWRIGEGRLEVGGEDMK